MDDALIACCDNTTATFDLVSRRNVATVFLDRVPLGVKVLKFAKRTGRLFSVNIAGTQAKLVNESIR